jgi:AcrR family transcriptional regulator
MTATRRRNATYYTGDLRRDLLDAALRAVETAGPSVVTLRALARELGVSHAAPAHHFPDKTALFTAIALEGFTLLEHAMTEALTALPSSAGGVAQLRATGIAYLRFALTHRAHFEVMWRDDLLDSDSAPLAEAGDATFAHLAAGVRAAQAEGWAAGADPRDAAFLAWSTVHGLAALWLAGPLRSLADRPFDEVADAVAGLLTATLRPSAPASRPRPPGPTSTAVPDPTLRGDPT